MAKKGEIKNSCESQIEMAAQERMGVIVPGRSRRWKPFAVPGRSLLWSEKMRWTSEAAEQMSSWNREKDGLDARNCGEGRGKVRWCIYRVTPPQDSGFRIDELFTLQQHGAILRQLFGGNDYDWEIISESKDISLWNWGACVDTIFWHVPKDWRRKGIPDWKMAICVEGSVMIWYRSDTVAFMGNFGTRWSRLRMYCFIRVVFCFLKIESCFAVIG